MLLGGRSDTESAYGHFRIGSVTKTMTAAVILHLAQDGALRLDDSVAKYRPDVPGGADITIGQLLNMRSSLYNYTADADFWPALERESTKEWTPEELLAIAFGHEHRGSGSSSTATPTRCCSASSPNSSTTSHCRRSFETVCSSRWE